MKDIEKQIEEKDKMFILNNILQEVKPLKLKEKIYWRIVEFMNSKLPEDSIVISREDWKDNHDQALMYGKKEGSKETAEKIYLQAKVIVDSTKWVVQGREYLHIDALKELVKQVGAEIKE